MTHCVKGSDSAFVERGIIGRATTGPPSTRLIRRDAANRRLCHDGATSGAPRHIGPSRTIIVGPQACARYPARIANSAALVPKSSSIVISESSPVMSEFREPGF
jgi:hypothetical protein